MMSAISPHATHSEIIPLIDLSPSVAWQKARASGHPRASHTIPDEVMTQSTKLNRALCEVGVIYISGHDVSLDLQSSLIQSARDFFARSLEDKNVIQMKHAGRSWRGYFAEGSELTAGRPDYKEGLYFGEEHSAHHPLVQRGAPMHGANQWPNDPRSMKPDVLAYCREMSRIATLLIELISLGLGLPDQALIQRFTCAGTQDPTRLFRIFHYPRHAWTHSEDEWGVRAHTDMGFLTVLLQDQEGGLQAQLRSGVWVDVPPKEHTFVVNIGDMLELWTWGHLRATLHRVKSPTPNTSLTSGRLSFPFFFDPAWDAPLTRIDRTLLPSKNNAYDAQSKASERWDGLDLSQLNDKTTYGQFVWRKVSHVFPHLAQS